VYPTRSANRKDGVERRRHARCERSSPTTVLQACINIRVRIKLHPSMKRKRKSQAERRQETREEVLAAASRVFAMNGFHGTSLDAVAEEAGFSRGAVYYNFADKEQLFLELLDRRCAERARDIREVFGTGGDDIASTAEQAQLAAREALDAMIGDPEWRALYLEFLAHAARDKTFRRAFAQRTDEMRAALDEVVVERAALVDEDALGMTPQELAVVIDALGVGLWSHHMLHGSRAVSPDLFSQAIGLMIEGVVARAGATAPVGGTA
jgi:AcrR family transcriptional regulator